MSEGRETPFIYLFIFGPPPIRFALLPGILLFPLVRLGHENKQYFKEPSESKTVSFSFSFLPSLRKICHCKKTKSYLSHQRTADHKCVSRCLIGVMGEV